MALKAALQCLGNILVLCYFALCRARKAIATNKNPAKQSQ